MKGYKKIIFFKLIIFYLLFTACSTIDLIKREAKDLSINESNRAKLNGKYYNSCSCHSTWKLTEMVFNKRQIKRSFAHDSITFQINSIDNKSLELKFFEKDSLLGTKLLKGKYGNGYFSAKTIVRIEIGLFPLLWGQSDQSLSFGVTETNDLVLLESHGGLAILVVAPIGGNNGQGAHEYKRIE